MSKGSGILEPRPAIGVGAMLLTTIVIPLMGVAVKSLAGQGVTTMEMLAVRSLLVVAVLTPLLLIAANRRALIAADKRAHFVHAAFGLVSMACFYYSLRSMPLVTVTTINFTTPIFVTLFARFLFQERLGWRNWTAVVVGFLGTIIVLRPDASGINLDSGVVLLGSFLAACMLMAIRRMPARSSNFAVIYYYALFGAVTFGIMFLPTMRMPAETAWPWLLALSGLALAVHSLLTFAYRLASSMVVGALDYLRLLWAGLLGYLLFEEIPEPTDGLGMALILASGIYIMYRQGRQLRPAAVKIEEGSVKWT